MSKDKIEKVTTKSGKKKTQAPRVHSDSLTMPDAKAEMARMAQRKQTKLLDETTERAIMQHRVALRELERY